MKFSLEASRMALDANAPEEVLRVVDVALPSAAGPTERVMLLEARDRAFEMLRRPADRLQGLAELSALAEALGDKGLERDLRLRRAASYRMQDENERAGVLAREVRELAAADGDAPIELAACLELGQVLLTSPLGEGYYPSHREADFDGAAEAYGRGAELARELGDDASLAAVLRELGVVQLGRIRGWFIDRVDAGEHVPYMRRVAAGESIEDLVGELPIAANVQEAAERFQEALEIFERLGDRRGAMSTIIAMGYLNWAADIHMGSGAGAHIEEIRRIVSTMKTFTNESEQAAFEAQLLYGVHVFSRAKVIPDLAISRGGCSVREGEVDRRPAARVPRRVARPSPTRTSAITSRRRRGWTRPPPRDREPNAAASPASRVLARRRSCAGRRRGARAPPFGACGRARDRTGERRRAVRGARAARARDRAPRRRAGRRGLLEVAERSARAAELAVDLPGHPPWGAQADAGLAQIALARGDTDAALRARPGRRRGLLAAHQEDLHLDILLPIAQCSRPPARPVGPTRDWIQLSLAMVAQRIDEDVGVRWFRGPWCASSALTGPLEVWAGADGRADHRAGRGRCRACAA